MASEAIGGEHLGSQYYLSFRFVGTVLGTSLNLCAAYAAYLLPVGILSYINADIGMEPMNTALILHSQSADSFCRTRSKLCLDSNRVVHLCLSRLLAVW